MAKKKDKYTIVVPTYNEPGIKKTLRELLKLPNCSNIIVVDESSDGTPMEVLSLINSSKAMKKKVKLILRNELENDLSQSILLGLKSATTKYVAVMDGDGQHPPIALERMFLHMIEPSEYDFKEKDIAIACRQSPYFEDTKRDIMTTVGIAVCKFRINQSVKDPLSGCFMVHTNFIKKNWEAYSHVRGYKLLFEMLKSDKLIAIYETPIKLRPRLQGESKLTTKQMLQFAKQILR